jgi:hypothetical protein
MNTFLSYLDFVLLRGTLTSRGAVDGEFEPAGDGAHGKRSQTQTALSWHATARDVKAKAVSGAPKQAPFQLATCK